MKDHIKYFDEHADESRTSEVLPDGMVGFYHDLYVYRQRFFEQYINDPRLPVIQQSDLPISEHGKNILSSSTTIDILAGGLAPLIDILALHNPGLGIKPLGMAIAADAGTQGILADAIIDMDLQHLEQFAIANKTGTDVVIFVMVNWLKPFFIAMREKQIAQIAGNDVLRQCPFCGSRPDMAVIVSGKDGKRLIHCSLCEHQWQYRRIACAVCGTEDATSLEYLSSEDVNRYRIDVCNACNGYIKTVRLNKSEDLDESDLSVENIFTPHLDSAAIKKGYKRP